jgi:chromosome partitioning protein
MESPCFPSLCPVDNKVGFKLSFDMSTVIAIVNQKGGVGKTTTSVNVAAALAHLNFKTLLIDMDPQGHSGEHLGIKPQVNQGSLSVINKESTLLSSVVPTYLPNLWVLPANIKLGQFNQNSPVGRQFALREVITEEVRGKFDFILVDCQPSLSLLTLNALTACDKVVLPVQAEFLALDGLTQLILTLKEIQSKMHPKLQVLGVVLTMFDKRNRLSFEVRQELEKNFGSDLFQTAIPRSVKLAEAPSFAKSVFEYAPDSFGAESYLELTKEIVSKISLKT